jgi:polyphosphate kinase
MLPDRFFPRDLSWLSFNYRVLMEARDHSLALYERIKFLAIYSSNLDEFFRVRVASIQSLLKVKKKNLAQLEGDPEVLLEQIFKEVDRQQEEFGRIFREEILPELRNQNIHILLGPPTHQAHIDFIDEYFDNEMMPVLHPEILVKDKIRHFLRDGVLYLALRLYSRTLVVGEPTPPESDETGIYQYALLQIPTHYAPRFINLPMVDQGHHIMFLEDLVRHNLHKIFPGYVVDGAFSIKMNRNADLQIEDEYSGDLVAKIRESLSKRRTGVPSRFIYDKRMPKPMVRYLRDCFELRKREVMKGGQYHNFNDFFAFPNPYAPRLQEQPSPPLPHHDIDTFPTLFDAIRQRNWLIHLPYHTYDYVLRFLNRSATDPDTMVIKTKLYRVASNSAIVAALIRAAQNGKDVTVFVELKARFDEASNLQAAKELEAAGVKIIYSIPGLKVHAKVAMVERFEQGRVQRYAFLSTGNFNEKTAKIYADHGFFTCDPEITHELSHVFTYLENRAYQPPPFRHLLVAQFNLRHGFEGFIDREMAHAREGKPAEMIIKLNNLEDSEMIDKLYEAGKAGVKIQLIIRGICCLRPGVEGLSENISAIRLVDRYLEHARVFWFRNDGQEQLFLASADWMERNLNRRIEVGFPVPDADLREEIKIMLEYQMKDNTKAVRLGPNLENIPIAKDPNAPVRMQADMYAMIQSGELTRMARERVRGREG